MAIVSGSSEACSRQRNMEYTALGISLISGYPLDPTTVAAYNLTMNLKQANPYLKSASARAKALWISAQTSSAVEGIHRPFAGGVKAWKPSSLQAFIAHWKRLASKSVR